MGVAEISHRQTATKCNELHRLAHITHVHAYLFACAH
jgi:hypothetical protein